MKLFSPRVASLRLYLLVCLLLPGLLACGFQLRGTNGSLKLPFQTLYLAMDARSPLAIELTRNLRATGGTQLQSKAQDAQATLEVLAETRDKAILSLNSAGRVREYVLTHGLRFRVVDKLGRELIMPTEINLKRTISFNEAQVLAKEAEEALLFRDMQTDLVQQLLRRLSAIQVQGS